MWDNMGRKLQALAKAICYLGIAGSFIWAIIIWSQSNRYQSTFMAGLLTLVIGSLVSWIGSWTLYGFGLIVENAENGNMPAANIDNSSDNSAVKSLMNSLAEDAHKRINREAEDARNKRIIEEGGWKCTCGRVNFAYVSTCGCGKNKREVLAAQTASDMQKSL